MKKFSFLFFAFLLARFALSQPVANLFQTNKVNSIYITIPADSLQFLYANPLNEKYLLADFIFTDQSRVDTLKKIGFRLRGNSSRFAQKKSFKISFNTFVASRKFGNVKKLNLMASHNDPTMIRQNLFYHCWKKAGLVERRAAFYKLYINGSYFGLYSGLEEMDKDWLMRVYGENAGNLYKCTYPSDLAFLGTDQNTYKAINSTAVTGGRAYELQTNTSVDDYSGLVQLIALLDQNPDAAFATEIRQRIGVRNFLKAFALDIATGNWDDYAYNKNNFYLYQNLSTQKFEFITYDADNTFGVDWIGKNWATRNCTDWLPTNQVRPLATKLLAVPAFRDMFYEVLDSITRKVMHPDSLTPIIQAWQTLITPAAEEDTYRTLDYGYTMEQFNNGFTLPIDNHTPFGIIPFLSTRYQSTIEQVPVVSVSKTESKKQVYFHPNPVRDRLEIVGLEPCAKLFITDMLGKVNMQQFVNAEGKAQLSTNKLPAGVYFFYQNGAEKHRFLVD